MQRYTKSLAYLERAKLVTPGGAQTLSKRANRFPERAYPVALAQGCGPYVYDVDGNKYLDLICGLACMTLGYNRGEILSAVQRQLGAGVSFSLATELEAEVAEKICSIIPCAEMVRFTKTGSESTEAAIRIARKATGQGRILAVGDGYNSWHSWFQVLKPEHPGIPHGYTHMVQSFNYNDLDSLKRHLDYYAQICEPVAGVIMEPCHYEQPAPGFLEGVRELCNQHGAVLIFDEMVTGFRWANGGAQQYYNVTPDLACFGKACANGFPVSFVCGKREIMEHADVVSGTFGGECLSLAACNAVLDIYRSEKICETLWTLGHGFQHGVNDLADVLDMPYVTCDGFAVKPRIRFTINHVDTPDRTLGFTLNEMAMSLFLQETALRSILWHPAGGNISAAMTHQDIDQAVSAMGEALVVVKKAVDSGDWSVLHGQPIQTGFQVRKG